VLDRQLLPFVQGCERKIQLFKEEYNGFTPHSSLSGLTPNEVVQRHSNGPNFPYSRPVAELGGAQKFESLVTRGCDRGTVTIAETVSSAQNSFQSDSPDLLLTVTGV
jgi:hypothetical protein